MAKLKKKKTRLQSTKQLSWVKAGPSQRRAIALCDNGCCTKACKLCVHIFTAQHLHGMLLNVHIVYHKRERLTWKWRTKFSSLFDQRLGSQTTLWTNQARFTKQHEDEPLFFCSSKDRKQHCSRQQNVLLSRKHMTWCGWGLNWLVVLLWFFDSTRSLFTSSMNVFDQILSGVWCGKDFYHSGLYPLSPVRSQSNIYSLFTSIIA